jgi:hypothetical protein
MLQLLAARATSVVAVTLARAVATLSLFVTLAANVAAIKRARAILLMANGGFGHSVVAPDWLRRLHSGGGTLTLFAVNMNDGRHNPLISELWGRDRFVWVRKGITLPKLGSVYDAQWVTALFRATQRLLRWLLPKTPCYCSYDELIAATPSPAWLDPNDGFNQRYESRYYPLMQARPARALRVGASRRREVTQALKARFGSDFSGRCTLYIRYLTEPNETDRSSANRLSAPLDDYVPAIRVLNRRGFQVLLTGDALAPPDLMDKMNGGLVDWRALGVDPHVFRLFAGTEVDLHIGSLSGGSAYVFVTDIPALMLNAFAPGDALPRTTVSYKWLYGQGDQLVSLEPLLGGMFFDHQLHGCRLIDNSPGEMAEIVADFLAHSDERPYGVDPTALGIGAPWIRAANARLSPAWLANYRRRAAIRACPAAQP